MLDAAPLEHLAELLDFSTSVVPTRIGRPVSWTSLDLVDDRVPLLPLGAVDDVGVVDADERLVGRDRDDVELVDLPELVGLGHGRAGHARELLVELEEVLQRDRGQRLRLLLDLARRPAPWPRPPGAARRTTAGRSSSRPVNSSTMMMLISPVSGWRITT